MKLPCITSLSLGLSTSQYQILSHNITTSHTVHFMVHFDTFILSTFQSTQWFFICLFRQHFEFISNFFELSCMSCPSFISRTPIVFVGGHKMSGQSLHNIMYITIISCQCTPHIRLDRLCSIMLRLRQVYNLCLRCKTEFTPIHFR